MANISKAIGSGLKAPRERGPVVARMESMSKEGRFYEIREASDGSHLFCDCPAWRFQKGKAPQDRTCKHLAAFRADRALSAPKAAAKALKA